MNIGKLIGVMFLDLSKAFDSINHNFIGCKGFRIICFRIISLQLKRNYLKNQKERVNINSSFSEWETIPTGFPRVSILGPLLFYFFLNYLFSAVTHSHQSNYGDGNTLYCFSSNVYRNYSNSTRG